MFFYSLIDIESLSDQLPIGASPRFREVRKRAFSILNNSIMAVVFERLPAQYKEEFADRLIANPSDPALINYLIERAGPTIEDDIRQEFQKVLEKLTPLLARIENDSYL